MFAVRIPKTAAMLSLEQTAPTPPADRPASYSVQIKRLESDPDCSSPSSFKVKNAWSCTSIRVCAFMTSPRNYYAPPFRFTSSLPFQNAQNSTDVK